MARRVLPFFTPPSLLIRQASVLAFINRSTGWQVSSRWIRDLGRLLRIAAGAKKYGCFGYAPHPVYEITAKCNLRCIHCHARGGGGYPGELDTRGAMRVIESLTTVGEFRTLVFTGGEPLVRKDIILLTRYANELGFNIVYATNGTLITPSIARNMARNGVVGAAISLDSVNPRRHDWFRGIHGSWRRAVDGMLNVLKEGMYLQVNITISRFNINEMEKLVHFADKLGAHVILLYTFVSFGRGIENKWLALTPVDMEKVIARAAKLQSEAELIIAPIAAPWYYAYLTAKSGIPIELAKKIVTGCIAARGMFYIKPDGEVWPCPFIPISAGNVAKKPAIEIWHSSLFENLRNRENLEEPCRSCPYREVCGGCRARSFLATGNLYSPDPLCPLVRAKTGIQATEEKAVKTAVASNTQSPAS